MQTTKLSISTTVAEPDTPSFPAKLSYEDEVWKMIHNISNPAGVALEEFTDNPTDIDENFKNWCLDTSIEAAIFIVRNLDARDQKMRKSNFFVDKEEVSERIEEENQLEECRYEK